MTLPRNRDQRQVFLELQFLEVREMEQQHGLRRAPRQTKKRDSLKVGGSVRAIVRSSTPIETYASEWREQIHFVCLNANYI